MITRIRKREEALTESHRRLEDIINFLPDPTFVINLEGKIIAWNKATEEMTGIPARDILGKGNYEHGLAFYGERHPILIDLILSDDKEIGKKYPEFQKTGDKFTGVGYIPLAYGGKGAHFVAISSPLYNTRGEITGAIESLRDVTDRKRAEELLRESEERYRALFRDNPSMFFTMDSEGKIISVNPFGADQLGYTVDELIGQPVLNVFYESDREAVAGQFKICLQNPGQIYHWQFRKIRKDGSLLWVEEVSRAICGSGSDMNVLVVCQDITERKRVENALYRATKKLNLLNSIAFTDIQNAIFSLSGYMELEKIVPINEKLQQFLDKEIGIVRTISESLKFVNMYQGLGLKPPAWQKVQQSFLMGISHLDILKFSRTLDVEGLVIYADPLLENVFFTLAENVVLHGKTATEISLWYHESPEGLTLFFEDNGMGIQNDMKEKIFDRRYQEGKGMGLFLVREILSITGITIKETGEPGKGARFEMTVPKEAYWFEWRP
jgi:PAS domain S-box-containing protein